MLHTDPEHQIPPHEAAQKLRLLLAKVEQTMPTAQLPAATPPRGPARMTIGMATYDDYDGVYFTVQAIRLYHPEILDDIEIIVIDNHPEGVASHNLKGLDYWIPNYRYIPYRAWRGTAVRDLIFREAQGEYVVSLDAHVMLVPGALKKLLDYFEAHPDTRDLLQGPLLYDDLRSISTHFEPGWRQAMYGTWATDERGQDPAGEPFEIPMQGLGLFACRRAVWPGFNPRLRGFGAEEGYIHAKIRRAGGRVLCLPFLRWVHRFGRPTGVPYSLTYDDRVRNYLITLRELGMDESAWEAHFKTVLGEEAGTRLVAQARIQLDNPFLFFDAVYCINLDDQPGRWDAMSRRFEQLGIGWVVRRMSAVKTPDNHHVGCALSHRQVIAEAKLHGLAHVLVVEDDAIFHRHTLEYLRGALDELRGQDWDLFYFGGHRWGRQYPLAPGCEYLERPHGLTCTHAIAYHHTIYDRLLAALPETEAGMAAWLAQHHGIDQFLMGLQDGAFVTRPSLATQPFLLAQEDSTQREQYVI